jgi:predicted nucleotidyltransferase
VNFNNSLSLRRKVAREAASLLYFGVEKEYKQAKLKAAKTFGVHFLPTNLEVAIEFDKIAEENEGAARQKRLIRMRKEALRLMKILEEYKPVLIGSVWRGTIHRESDIDIAVYHDEPAEVLKLIKQNNLKVTQTEWTTVTKQGLKKTSFHIYLESPIKEKAEIVVRSPEEIGCKGKCEIYGDTISGLHLRELEKVLEENSTQRFVPF